jgi:hypothetical protein
MLQGFSEYISLPTPKVSNLFLTAFFFRKKGTKKG